MTTLAHERAAPSAGVAGAARGRAAGRRDRCGPRRAVAGRRADRDGPARSGAGDHLRPAVRAGRGRDRGRRRGRVVPVRRVPGAAAAATGSSTPTGIGRCASGTVASAIWAVCAALLVPLTVSDVTGQPLTSRLSPSDIWSVAGLVETAGAWRWTAVLAAIVTVVEHPGAALVVDAGAVRGVAGDAAAACADRAFVVGRLARPGHQQPAHPLDRRRAVGGRPAGAARRMPARRRARSTWPPAGSRLSRCGASSRWRVSGVVNALVRIRPGDLLDERLRLADHRQGRRAVHAGRHRLAAAAPWCRRAASRPGGAAAR